jgi:hypothetical protein
MHKSRSAQKEKSMERRTGKFRRTGFLRTAFYSTLLWSVALLFLPVGRGAFGDELADVSARPLGEEAGFNLASLARLEQETGNGGAEEAGASSIQAGYDNENGFFLSDKDKQGFLLRLSGYMQIRYVYKGRDKRGDTVDANEVGGADDSFFEIRRARLAFSGFVLNKNLKYKIMVDGNTGKTGARGSGGGMRILDVYVFYSPGDDLGFDKDLFGIGVGQFKPYFMRQEATSAAKLQMVDRSLTDEFFNVDRNLGMWVQGDIGGGSVFYAFAVTNGFDSVNDPTDTVDQFPALILKLDFNLMGGNLGGKYEEGNVKCDADNPFFAVGVSGAYDQNDGSSGVLGEHFKVYTFGLDTAFKWSVVSLQAEYVGRWLDYSLGNGIAALAGDGRSHYAHGFYIQGGFFIIPQILEVTARVATVFTDDGPNNGNAVEAGPGLSWYISHDHRVKLQTELMYFDVSADLPNQTENLDESIPRFSTTAGNLEAGEQGVMLRMQLQLAFGYSG